MSAPGLAGRPPTHRYVAVLGSCCTGDAVGATTFEAISSARLRLVLFQGRTSFPSLASGPLSTPEFELAPAEGPLRLDWGYRMAADEVSKLHMSRLDEVIPLTDALVVDHVGAFVFSHLVDAEAGRYFVRSWEWDRFVHPCRPFQEVRLWEIPLDLSLRAMRQVLDRLYQRRPDLSLIFHMPAPAFNDGVAFEDAALAAHLDCYYEYCDRLFAEASRGFPRVSALQLPPAPADPRHPSGPHPFRFHPDYRAAVRGQIERTLGLASSSAADR